MSDSNPSQTTPEIISAGDASTLTSSSKPTKTLSAAGPEPGTSVSVEPTSTVASPAPDARSVAVQVSPEPMPKHMESMQYDVTEPHSTLTKQFMQAEWEALKALRVDLPHIFADVYPDNPAAKDTAITLWGVRIDPHNPKDARVSVVLMKFLRARNLSVRDARDMLVSTLRWRDSFKIDSILQETFPQDIFEKVGYVQGRDKEGRPVVYNFYGVSNVHEVFQDVQRFIRWRVALQEKSIAMLDFSEVDQMIQIHDYDGVSLSSRDANSKNAASEATSIFQGHYPEFLHKKFFINVPTLLNWIFWAFKPLISANTLAKMSVVGHGHHAIQKALLPVIDIEQMPTRYGGQAEENQRDDLRVE